VEDLGVVDEVRQSVAADENRVARLELDAMRSTWTCGSNPTERVMMFRKRLCFASSALIAPALSCSLTRE